MLRRSAKCTTGTQNKQPAHLYNTCIYVSTHWFRGNFIYNYLNQICLCLPCVNLYSTFKRNLYSSDSEIRYCTYQYIVWISFTHYFVTVRLVCQRKIIINNSVGKLHDYIEIQGVWVWTWSGPSFLSHTVTFGAMIDLSLKICVADGIWPSYPKDAS